MGLTGYERDFYANVGSIEMRLTAIERTSRDAADSADRAQMVAECELLMKVGARQFAGNLSISQSNRLSELRRYLWPDDQATAVGDASASG